MLANVSLVRRRKLLLNRPSGPYIAIRWNCVNDCIQPGENTNVNLAGNRPTSVYRGNEMGQPSSHCKSSRAKGVSFKGRQRRGHIIVPYRLWKSH